MSTLGRVAGGDGTAPDPRRPASERHEEHEDKVRRVAAAFRERREGTVRLSKDTSNLFRARREHRGRRLDVRDLDSVLAVGTHGPAAGDGGGFADVEGMTPYAAAVDATLAAGAMPAVVPELRSITVGGALSGVGIEATSFRCGLVHETVEEVDVLVGDGRVLTASPDNDHADLFFALPNSYGTLGYALRVRVRTAAVQRYVHVTHRAIDRPAAFFEALAAACDGDADFVEGVVFAPGEHYLCVGRFCDEAPYTSDYAFERMYWRSIRERDDDYLSVRDFIWRWDTDWFWCSKNVYAQNPIVRRLYGRARLNSITYQKIMRWNTRWGLTRMLDRVRGVHAESVIQDVDVPIEHAAEFLDFFRREIDIRPAWICPVRRRDPEREFPLFPMRADTTYVNFGFWDVIRTREPYPEGHFNRLVERKVAELGGIKSLYSDSFYGEREFWSNYDREAYDRAKRRYDPKGAFGDLYRKCVLRE